MATNHAAEAASEYGGESFEGFDFDQTPEPDLNDGRYEVSIEAKSRMGNADNEGKRWPQIQIRWKAEAALDQTDECVRSVGRSASEWLTFKPSRDLQGNITRQRLAAIRNKFGIESDVIPARIESLDDLQPFCDALNEQRTVIQAINKIDGRGINRTNIFLNVVDDAAGEGEAEPKTTTRPTAAAARKPAASKGSKTKSSRR